MFKFKNEKHQSNTIPDELKNGFTMNGKIPVLKWYFEPGSNSTLYKWSNDSVNKYVDRFTPTNIKNNNEGVSTYGHEVCVNLLKSFEDFNIVNKKIAVIGSETPWIEAILINMNNNVTTIEYNLPEYNFEKLKCRDYFNYFEKNREKFEVIVTFSSIEHSGLGRYGDPLDPEGDIKTMDCIYKNLNNDGLVIWGAPVGSDNLTWNAHRVYGKIRLPLIFNKFQELKWYGREKEQLFNMLVGKHNYYQPVVVLKK